MSRTDDNYAKENDSGISCSGCGCFLVLVGLGIAFNIPAILDFILRWAGK